jgi:hypothetical protein
MLKIGFTLSRHAQDRMASRQIPHEWIERLLRNPARVVPDPVDSDLKQAFGIIPEMDNRVLRIVYNGRNAVPHIVTVHFYRRMKGLL